MVKHSKTRRFRDDSETISRRCKLVSDMAMCETVRTARGEADPFAAQLGLLPAGFFLHTGAVQLRAAGSATVATVLYIAKLQFYLGK